MGFGVCDPTNLPDFTKKASPKEGEAFLVNKRRLGAAGPKPVCYFTPIFFCNSDDDVVYWKRSFLSG